MHASRVGHMGEYFSTTLPRYQGQRGFIQLDRKSQERHQRTVVTSIPNPRDVQLHQPAITPEDLQPAAVPNLAMINVQRQLFTAFMQLPAMNPAPINEQTTVGAAINNIDGNKL